VSPDDIASIEARAAAATEGPWVMDHVGPVWVGNRSDGRTSGLWEIIYGTRDNLSDLTPEGAAVAVANAEFIAHAREDVPALIAEVERLREATDQHTLTLLDRTHAAEQKQAAAEAKVARVRTLADEADASGRHINGYGYVLLRDLRAAIDRGATP
jgi:sugar phosphate isomerase/epimerase